MTRVHWVQLGSCFSDTGHCREVSLALNVCTGSQLFCCDGTFWALPASSLKGKNPPTTSDEDQAQELKQGDQDSARPRAGVW
jgi:hypothetical protein